MTARKGKTKRIKDLLMTALLSLLSGVAVGVVVTVYNVLVGMGESLSVDAYAAFYAMPYLIPLLVFALLAAALCIGTALRFMPLARGSGIPQTEGSARGLFRLRPFSLICTSFAMSLAAVFLGLNAGAEGPSVLMGACAGEGVAKISKSDESRRRALVAASAGAGFATAFNAPVSGVVFAAEEASRKISPAVVLSAFLSVLSALSVRVGVRTLFSLAYPSVQPFEPSFTAFDLTTLSSFGQTAVAMGLAAIVAVIAACVGAGFYHSIFAARGLLGRIRAFKGAGVMIVPFLLACVFGMLSPYAMGGGHSLMQAVGTAGGTIAMSAALRFSSPLAVALAVILVAKFVSTACNMGAGVPCGAFVPMLSTGACIGALISVAATAAGLPAIYSDIIVWLGIAAFFTSVVKAPVTATVMVFELTGSYDFTLLLPVVTAVAASYVMSTLLRMRPVYDCLLVPFVLPEVTMPRAA